MKPDCGHSSDMALELTREFLKEEGYGIKDKTEKNRVYAAIQESLRIKL
jgi:threonine aldolase